MEVARDSPQALDQICDQLVVPKDVRQKHELYADQLTGKTDNAAEAVQSINESFKNSIEYDNKMISIEINLNVFYYKTETII